MSLATCQCPNPMRERFNKFLAWNFYFFNDYIYEKTPNYVENNKQLELCRRLCKMVIIGLHVLILVINPKCLFVECFLTFEVTLNPLSPKFVGCSLCVTKIGKFKDLKVFVNQKVHALINFARQQAKPFLFN